MLCLAVWFLRYTRHFFGPSSYSLRIAVGHRAPPNKSSANHMAERNNMRFSELWRICVVAGFPLDFPVVFTVSINMIRLTYIIESCQSFQTVLFSGLRNISLQILRMVGRVWNEGSRMLCQRLPSPSTTTKRLVLQNLPSLGLRPLIRPPPIWRVLNKLRNERLPNNEALQWAILSTQRLLRVVFCHNAVSVNFKHDIRGSKFTLIIETLKPV